VDRIKDVIIAGGYNIYPRHVEEAIYDHIHVEECIVAGVPDEYRGETVKAWIKRRRGSGLNEEELRDFLTDKLSKIEIPKQFDIRDTELPKTMVGKLSRKAVLEEDSKD
jgi:long-chain acyl-CoA synthetase